MLKQFRNNFCFFIVVLRFNKHSKTHRNHVSVYVLYFNKKKLSKQQKVWFDIKKKKKN